MIDLTHPGAADFATLTGFEFASPSNGPAEHEIHGTTVISVKYSGGVLCLGDRRATGGFAIMFDRAEKVLSLDDHTLMAISGSFSRAMEFVRYLRHAFKYYERSQLQPLSLEGKLNEIGRLVAGNAPAAMQGIGMVIPILALFDPKLSEGRIFYYDGGGARFEQIDYGAAGSGSAQIKGAFEYIVRTKGPFTSMTRDEALQEALTLLEIAADLDAATGGASKVLPLAKTITAAGIEDIEEDVLRAAVRKTLTAEPRKV